jgi:hypothetical protein
MAKMDAHESWEDRHRVYALKLFLTGVEDELRIHGFPMLAAVSDTDQGGKQ